MTKKAVIVLPTYNEKQNIEKFVDEVLSQEKKAEGWEFELLIVDSRSSDGTVDIVKRLVKANAKIHLLSVDKGLGVALIEGHKYSIKHFKPDALVQLDADAQVDAEVLPRLLKVLDEGYTMAIGSRFVKGGKNMLSFSRRLFSNGSSWFCRVVMGPWNIGEFTNSARAFTPELFNKINFDRLPWREQTFIIQPAFLNEVILAGARYKEIPLIFKDRAEGYSKMKVFNYTYDVITYAIDVRLHKLGINIPLFKWTRQAKTIIKFSVVGFSGTAVDFIFYNLFILSLGFKPATAKGFSTEIAIINNFTFNNVWTFRHRKTNNNFWQKLIIFNLVSFGGLAIGVVIVKYLHTVYGDGYTSIFGIPVAYYNLYFFATIIPVLIWNFTINHFVTWKHQERVN